MGQLDKSVKFSSRGSDYSLFLTSTEAVFSFSQPDEQKIKDQSLASNRTAGSQTPKRKTAVVRMRMVGANPNPRIEGLGLQSAKTNYFIGNDPGKWKSNASSYGRVEYREVFPGIDLAFYSNQQEMEYDFIVAPGANPNKVKLEFKGADRIHVDARGDLIIHTPLGELRQKKPIIYQETQGVRKQVTGGYVVRGKNQVGFSVGEYDTARQLVIDPTLVYSTYLGGSVRSEARGIAVYSDPITGITYAYIVGNTRSQDFPTRNALQPSYAGNANGDISDEVFITKLNMSASGADSLVFSTYLGGNGTEEGSSIAVDSMGNAYLTGRTSSTNFPLANTLQTSAGDVDAFVVKVKADGSALIYSTYLGGSGFDRGNSIAVDAGGNAYVTGDTSSPNFPTQNALQTQLGVNIGAPGIVFVSKIAPPSGASPATLTYSTYLGGTGRYQEFSSNGIATDSLGNAYVTGVTSSHDFPVTANAYQPTNVTGGFGRTCFISKINTLASGIASLPYSTYFGGTDSYNGTGDVCRAIAVDADGKAYVTGTALSRNFPTTPGAFKSISDDDADAFVAKIDMTKSGSQGLVYSTLLGGPGGRSNADEGWGIAVDAAGNAFVSGVAGTGDFPTVNPATSNMWGVYVTTDEGTTFGALSKEFDIAPKIDANAMPRTLYTLGGATGAILFRSIDNGVYWSAINSVPENVSINCLEPDPKSSATIYLGTDQGLFKSTNAGDTWSAINNGLNEGASTFINDLTFDTSPSAQTIFAGTSDNLYKSTDGGNSWLPTGLNMGTSNVVVNATTTPHTLFANLLRSTDGGTTWSPTEGFCDFIYEDRFPRVLETDPTTTPATIYANDPNGIFCGTGTFVKSTDNGTTWQNVWSELGFLIPQLVVDRSTSPSTLYRADVPLTETGGISKSTDGGNSWTPIVRAALGGPFAIDTSSRTSTTPSTIYFSNHAISTGFVAKLNPTGSALTFSTLLSAGVVSVAVDQGNIYVAGGSGSFLPTVNGVQTTHPPEPLSAYVVKFGTVALPFASATSVTTEVAVQSGTLAITFPNINGSTAGTTPTSSINMLDSNTTANLSLSNNLGAYEIKTSAIYDTSGYSTDPTKGIKIAFFVPTVNDPTTFNNLVITHGEDSDADGIIQPSEMIPYNGTIDQNKLTYHDFATRTVWVYVPSLSPFVIVKGAGDQFNDLVRLIKSFNLKAGIENSFDAKLQNALKAYQAALAKDRATACNQMNSFISEVQAQTSKALTPAQATQLINAANQIKVVLGCR